MATVGRELDDFLSGCIAALEDLRLRTAALANRNGPNHGVLRNSE